MTLKARTLKLLDRSRWRKGYSVKMRQEVARQHRKKRIGK